jgi:hypothetical protein
MKTIHERIMDQEKKMQRYKRKYEASKDLLFAMLREKQESDRLRVNRAVEAQSHIQEFKR